MQVTDYIPPEVVTEVLSRLPVKYVLRCRCVCKEWNTIISSPNLTSKHLSHSSSSSSPHTLVRYYSKLHNKEIYTLYNDDSFTSEYTRISFPFHENKKCGNYFRIVGYCNGLLCLSDDWFGRSETIILWNPSIKRSVTLPRTVYGLANGYIGALGFGYDSKRDDYKVVRLAYLLSDKETFPVLPPKVEVFSLSTGVWRHVENDAEFYTAANFWAQGFFHNLVHWVAFKKTKNNKFGTPYLNLVLKFDWISESFVELGLPDDLASLPPVNLRASTVKGFFSVIKNHTLSTMDFTRDFSRICSIWVMLDYGNVDSWTNIFNVTLEPGGLCMMLGFKSDGDTLFSGRNGELVSYHSENMEVTGTGIYGCEYSFFVDKYVESLVLLGKGIEVRGIEDEDETVEKKEFWSKMASSVSCTFSHSTWRRWLQLHCSCTWSSVLQFRIFTVNMLIIPLLSFLCVCYLFFLYP